MEKQHSSAGVYSRIRDFSVLTTTDVGMRVGIVGQFARGPVNEPFRTLSQDDWSDYFGKRNAKKYGFGGIAAHMMHPYTNRLFTVRLAPEAEYGIAYLTVDDIGSTIPNFYLGANTDDNGDPKGVQDPATIGWLPTDADALNCAGFFYASDPGEWNKNVTIIMTPNVPKGLDMVADADKYDTSKFKIFVFENYTPVSVPDETHVVTFDDYMDAEGRQYSIVDVLQRASRRIRFKRNPYFTALPVMTGASVTFTSGSDGRTATSAEIATAYAEHFGDREQLSPHMLVNVQGFDYIVHRAMLETAEAHNNCRAFLNMSLDISTVRAATDYRDNILNVDTYYGALYFGDDKLFDAEEARAILIPMVFQAAIAYMRSEFVKAPAGIRRSDHIKSLGPSKRLSLPERNALTDSQINYLRKMPSEIGGGYAIWEQLTLYRRRSALRNINVSSCSGRVLEICHIHSIYKLFDPQDNVQRTDLRSKVERELDQMQKAGAFNGLGTTPFKVICDDSNNPSSVIANNDMVLDVVIDPANAVRRIGLRYVLNPKGVRTTEF